MKAIRTIDKLYVAVSFTRAVHTTQTLKPVQIPKNVSRETLIR